jgi:hypothetical protein
LTVEIPPSDPSTIPISVIAATEQYRRNSCKPRPHNNNEIRAPKNFNLLPYQLVPPPPLPGTETGYAQSIASTSRSLLHQYNFATFTILAHLPPDTIGQLFVLVYILQSVLLVACNFSQAMDLNQSIHVCRLFPKKKWPANLIQPCRLLRFHQLILRCLTFVIGSQKNKLTLYSEPQPSWKINEFVFEN